MFFWIDVTRQPGKCVNKKWDVWKIARKVDPPKKMCDMCVFTCFYERKDCPLGQASCLTVRLTSIDHPQIEGAYISGLCAANFIFLVCVESSSDWRTPRNHWICIEHVGWLRYKLPQNLHRFRDVIFENFRVRMTSFYLTKLFTLSNFDRLYLRQYRSYEQTSKHRTASFWPEKGFGTSLGCHWYFFNDPPGTPSQMYSIPGFTRRSLVRSSSWKSPPESWQPCSDATTWPITKISRSFRGNSSAYYLSVSSVTLERRWGVLKLQVCKPTPTLA